VSNTQQVWWRPGGRSPFALDPAKPRLPQIVSAIGQSLIIFGGPLIGLLAINRYPFLIMDRTIYIGGLASIVFWFLASFVIYGNDDFPRGMPQQLKLVFRAGYGLCMSFLLLGIFGIANVWHGDEQQGRGGRRQAHHAPKRSDPSHVLCRDACVAPLAYSR
jgi:hypothetical protein